jgi:hypothetical protein
MRWGLIGVVVVAGCGPRALADTSGEGSGSAETTAASWAEGGDTDVTGVPPEGDSSTSTGSTSTADASTSVDVPTSVCDPQPEAISSELMIDGLVSVEQPEGEQLHDCIVESIGDGPDGATVIAFDCTDAELVEVAHTLSILAEPAVEFPFGVGDAVVFDLWTTVPWWGNEFLAIRDPKGELLFAFASAQRIPTAETDVDEWAEVPASTFFAPLELAAASPCEPDCEGAGGGIITAPCECEVRLAIDFSVGDETQRVLDRGTGTLPAAGLSLRVDRAVQWAGIPDHRCNGTDDPGRWYTFIAVRTR